MVEREKIARHRALPFPCVGAAERRQDLKGSAGEPTVVEQNPDSARPGGLDGPAANSPRLRLFPSNRRR